MTETSNNQRTHSLNIDKRIIDEATYMDLKAFLEFTKDMNAILNAYQSQPRFIDGQSLTPFGEVIDGLSSFISELGEQAIHTLHTRKPMTMKQAEMKFYSLLNDMALLEYSLSDILTIIAEYQTDIERIELTQVSYNQRMKSQQMNGGKQ